MGDRRGAHGVLDLPAEQTRCEGILPGGVVRTVHRSRAGVAESHFVLLPDDSVDWDGVARRMGFGVDLVGWRSGARSGSRPSGGVSRWIAAADRRGDGRVAGADVADADGVSRSSGGGCGA